MFGWETIAIGVGASLIWTDGCIFIGRWFLGSGSGGRNFGNDRIGLLVDVRSWPGDVSIVWKSEGDDLPIHFRSSDFGYRRGYPRQLLCRLSFQVLGKILRIGRCRASALSRLESAGLSPGDLVWCVPPLFHLSLLRPAIDREAAFANLTKRRNFRGDLSSCLPHPKREVAVEK